jgi:APA family basic amino acid/polyamine antiporter
VFSGFILALNSLVTVLGVFVLRVRQPDLPRPYRTFGYPVTPLVYLGLTAWTLMFVVINRTQESMLGLGVIVAGLIVYALFPKQQQD